MSEDIILMGKGPKGWDVSAPLLSFENETLTFRSTILTCLVKWYNSVSVFFCGL